MLVLGKKLPNALLHLCVDHSFRLVRQCNGKVAKSCGAKIMQGLRKKKINKNPNKTQTAYIAIKAWKQAIQLVAKISKSLARGRSRVTRVNTGHSCKVCVCVGQAVYFFTLTPKNVRHACPRILPGIF